MCRTGEMEGIACAEQARWKALHVQNRRDGRHCMCRTGVISHCQLDTRLEHVGDGRERILHVGWGRWEGADIACGGGGDGRERILHVGWGRWEGADIACGVGEMGGSGYCMWGGGDGRKQTLDVQGSSEQVECLGNLQ